MPAKYSWENDKAFKKRYSALKRAYHAGKYDNVVAEAGSDEMQQKYEAARQQKAANADMSWVGTVPGTEYMSDTERLYRQYLNDVRQKQYERTNRSLMDLDYGTQKRFEEYTRPEMKQKDASLPNWASPVPNASAQPNWASVMLQDNRGKEGQSRDKEALKQDIQRTAKTLEGESAPLSDTDFADYEKLANERRKNGWTIEDSNRKRDYELGKLTQGQQDALKRFKNADYVMARTKSSDANYKDAMKEYSDALQALQKVKTDAGWDDRTYRKYLQYTESAVNETRRKEQHDEEYDTLHDGKHDRLDAVVHSAESIARSPITGIGALAGNVAALANPDKDMARDTNSVWYEPLNRTQDTRGIIGEDLEKNTKSLKGQETDGTGITRGKIGRFLYDTLMSTGDSAVNLAAGGALGLGAGSAALGENVALGLMGSSAYGSALEAAQARGLGSRAAQTTAAAAGIIEVLTEKVPTDKLLDAFKTGKNLTKGQVAATVLKQAGLEGTEEANADALNLIADTIINGDKSEMNEKIRAYEDEGMTRAEAVKQAWIDFAADTAKDALSGAISGGLMAGGTVGASKAVSNMTANDYAKALTSADDFRAAAESVDDPSTYETKEEQKEAAALKKNLEEIAERIENGEEITQKEKTKAVQRMIDLESAASVEYGETQQTQEQEAAEQEATKAQNARVNRLLDIDGNRVYTYEDVPEDFRRPTAGMKAEDAVRAMGEATNAMQLADAYNEAKKSAWNGVADLSYEANARRLMEQGIPREELDEAKVSAEDAYLSGANGERASFSDTRMQAAYMAGLLRRANDIEAEKAPTTQRAVTRNGKAFNVKEAVVEDDGTISVRDEAGNTIPINDLTFRNEATATIYREADALPTVEAKKAFFEYLPVGIAVNSYARYFNRYYNAGRLGRSFADTLKNNGFLTKYMSEDDLKHIFDIGAKENRDEKKSAKTKTRKAEGKVIDKRRSKDGNDPLYKVAAKLAGVIGQDIELSEDLGDKVNGEFSKSMAKITLNVASDNAWNTLFHECAGEFLEAWNKNGMEDIQDRFIDYFIDTMGEDDFNRAVEKYQSVYEQAEGEKSFREAANELVNDAIAGIFSTENGINDFVDWLDAKSKPSVLQRIADYLRDIIDTIKDYIGRNANLSDASKRTYRMAEERAASLRARILSELEVARENYEKAAGEEGEQGDTRHSKYNARYKKSSSNTAGSKTPNTVRDESASTNSIPPEQKNATTKSGVGNAAHSLNVDSEGNSLSKGQQDYFKDSKIRDDEGRLKVVYHGTNRNFTVFDLEQARGTEDIEGFFFSGDQEEAGGYGNLGEYYLNITNPADYDTAYDIFFKYRGQEGAGTKARKELQELGYDGIIAEDEDAPEYTEYIAFASNQIKRTDNENPTEDDDIRYSLNVDGIDGYSEEEKERLEKGGSIIIAKNESDIADYVRKYANTNAKEKLYLGTVGRDLANRIKKDTGVDIEGYNISITNAFENKHNDAAKEGKQGQTAITPEKVALVPRIIADYDSVEASKKKNGQQGLVFKKDIDGMLTVVEYVSKGKHSIYLQTMYGKEKSRTERRNAEESANLTTSKTYTDKALSDSSIPPEQKNATTKSGVGNAAHSLNVDSEGNSLSKGQQDYFKDSKIRDGEGHLMPLYHQTDADFTIFDTRRKGAGASDNQTPFGIFMKSTPDDIGVRGSKQMKLYANITNPLEAYNRDDLEHQMKRMIPGYADIMDEYDRIDRFYAAQEKEADAKISDFMSEWAQKNPGRKRTDIYEDRQYNKLEEEQEKIIDRWGAETNQLGRRAKEVITSGLKGLGYDGVILKEDRGSFGRKTDAFIALSPEQVKNTDNRKPTKNSDIRFSLSVDLDDEFMPMLDDDEVTGDDVWFSYEGQAEAKAYSDSARNMKDSIKTMTGLLRASGNLFKGIRADASVVQKVAKDIRDLTQTDMPLWQITDNMQKIFDYMQSGDNIDFEDMVKVLSEVSEAIISQGGNVDPVMAEKYNGFLDYLRAFPIKLTDADKAAIRGNGYRSVKEFTNRYFGRIGFSNKGSSLDGRWSEIVEQSDGFLQIVGKEDQIIELARAVDEMKPQAQNDYGESQQEAAYDLAMQIMQSYYEAMAGMMKDRARTEMLQEGGAGAGVQKQWDDLRAKMRKEQARFRKESKRQTDELVKHYEEELKKAEINNESIQRRREELIEEVRSLDNTTKLLKTQLTDEKVKNRKLSAQLKRVAKQKAQKKDLLQNYKEMQDIRKEKESIIRTANRLIPMIDDPTNKKHVPESMREPLAQFLLGIDFVPHRAKDESENTRHWMQNMQRLSNYLAQVSNHPDEDASGISFVMDPQLTEAINDFIERNGDKPKVSLLSANELHELATIMRSISSLITRTNEAFMSKRGETIAQIGGRTVMEARSFKEKAGRLPQFMDQMLNVSMLDARSFFEETAGMEIYDALHEGQNIRTRDIKKAGEYASELVKGKKINEWRNDEHTFHTDDGDITLTTGQIMSLYRLMEREQAREHITIGGIKQGEIKESDLKKSIDRVKGKKDQKRPVHVTGDLIAQIVETLTPEQKKIADDLQKYMAEECAKDGNEVTMRMYGYRKFTDKNYFPIRVDSNSTATTDRNRTGGNVSMNAVINMSMTKNVTPHAKNAVMIDDIFSVYVNHCVDMATYHGMAMPLADALRWFNYKEIYEGTTEDGEIMYAASVKEEVERLMGKEGKKFFEILLEDLNGMSSRAHDDGFADALTGAYKGAAIGANLRVAIQQPTSYLRASMVMDPKYLMKAMGNAASAGKYAKKAQENSALAWWKSQGFYETSMGHSMEQMILGESTIGEKIKDKASILAQAADDLTWGVLYRAAELEVSDTRPDLKKGSDAYTKEVVKRFEDVIDQTQVVDTSLHRAQIMRSKGTGAKMITSFMSEPLKYWNMLHRAFVKSMRTGNVKPAAKAMTVYVLTNIVTAAAAAVIDAFRRDDDETPWDERWMEAAKENAIDNMNPIGMIPWVKDVYEIMAPAIKGESAYFSNAPERMDIAAFTALANAITAVQKDMEKGKITYKTKKKAARAISQFSGIPAYNVWRTVESIHNAFSDKNWGSGSTSTYDKVYTSIEKGEGIAEAITERLDEKIAEKIEKAADEEVAKQKYKGKTDIDRETVKNALDREVLRKKAAGDIKGAIRSKYKDRLAEETAGGNGAEMKNRLIQAFMKLGMTQQEANKYIDSWYE